MIANAARAIRADRAPPGQRWLLGLGSAAGLVLAAGIAWQVGKQIESQEAQTGPERSHRSMISVEPITESARVQKSVAPEADAGNAAVMSAPKAAPEQSRAPSPNSSVKLRQNMHLAPQDWLAEIVRLKNAGHRQEAIENLRLFRRMHPDWQLSDELRRLSE